MLTVLGTKEVIYLTWVRRSDVKQLRPVDSYMQKLSKIIMASSCQIPCNSILEHAQSSATSWGYILLDKK